MPLIFKDGIIEKLITSESDALQKYFFESAGKVNPPLKDALKLGLYSVGKFTLNDGMHNQVQHITTALYYFAVI